MELDCKGLEVADVPCDDSTLLFGRDSKHFGIGQALQPEFMNRSHVYAFSSNHHGQSIWQVLIKQERYQRGRGRMNGYSA